MTIQDHLDALSRLIAFQNQEIEQAMVISGNHLLANIKNRIVRDGKNSEGQNIGQYSTKPTYATAEQFDRVSSFKAQGKRESVLYGTANVKTKKFSKPKRQTAVIQGKETAVITGIKGYALGMRERTSMYLPGGYKELRNIQGKPIDKVNLNYRGDLIIIGYQLQAKDKEVLLGLINERESLKRHGLEKKYGGPILSATRQEIEDYNKEFSVELNELTIKRLKG